MITRIGPVYRLRLLDGEKQTEPEIIDCIARGAARTAVVGDVVRFVDEESVLGAGLITAIEARQNALVRADALGRRAQTLAANLDRIWIVSAIRPPPRSGLIDRYLVAAQQQGIAAGLLFNKIDLLDEAMGDELTALAEAYAPLDIPIHWVSAESGAGLEKFQSVLSHERVVLVGHSGVGKTSILNALIPTLEAEVRALSESSGRGQHTTTTSALYTFAGGGELIDSPGVRGFALWGVPPEELASYFPELAALAGECHFHNCQHLSEPRCAVRAALGESISQLRYDGYLRLRGELCVEWS